MQSKLLGIILSILGISGLILALVYMNVAMNSNYMGLVIAGGILAAILFFVGIWLVSKSVIPDKAVEVN